MSWKHVPVKKRVSLRKYDVEQLINLSSSLNFRSVEPSVKTFSVTGEKESVNMD